LSPTGVTVSPKRLQAQRLPQFAQGYGREISYPPAEPQPPAPTERSKQRQGALQRWQNEGFAGHAHLGQDSHSNEMPPDTPPLMNAELVQLQIRVIALENLVIALFAQTSKRKLHLAREMAAYISPRRGFTPHRLTIRAAAQMINLVERAGYFRVPRANE